MSLETLTNKVIFQGNDSTTVFPYTFIIPDASDAVVTFTDTDGTQTVLTTEYTISGLGDDNGGNVTYPVSGSPLATGASLTLQRIVPYTQTTVLTNQGGYYPDVVEYADDKIVMQTQQLAETLGRAVLYNVADEDTEQSLPVAALRAGKFLAFDVDGNATVSSGTGTDSALRTDLAASGGSALVGFIQAGAGAVARSVQAKLREIKTSADYGGMGADNIGIGTNALAANITTAGSLNIAIGTGALAANTTGVENVSIGPNTMLVNTTGTLNVALGYQALRQNSAASFNTALGHSTLFQNTTGENGTAVGAGAGNQNQTGDSNTYVGSGAGYNSVSSDYNTAIGRNSLVLNTGAGFNTVVGGEAGYYILSGSYNVAMGFDAAFNLSTGDYNVAIGDRALAGPITGPVTPGTGTLNVAIGSRALTNVIGGSQNTALGALAGYTISTGIENVIAGNEAGYALTTSSGNVILGASAWHTGTTGNHNTSVGYKSGYQSTGSGCVFLGYNAGYSIVTSNTLVIANSASGPYPIIGDLANNRIAINRSTFPTATPFAIGSLPAYANNAAAVAGGLAAGDLYRTNADPDPVCVVH